MKFCPKCQIEIGGDPSLCPLCQTRLTGEASPSFWPPPEMLIQKYKVFKAQLILLAGICVFMIIIDLITAPYGKVLWTPPLAIWIILLELTFYQIFLKKVSPIRAITQNSLLAVAAMFPVSVLFPQALNMISVFLSAMLVMNLLSLFFGKEDTAMIQLLGSLATGIISLVVIKLLQVEYSVFWIILLVTSCAVMGITLIFRMKYMLSELQKRTKI